MLLSGFLQYLAYLFFVCGISSVFDKNNRERNFLDTLIGSFGLSVMFGFAFYYMRKKEELPTKEQPSQPPQPAPAPAVFNIQLKNYSPNLRQLAIFRTSMDVDEWLMKLDFYVKTANIEEKYTFLLISVNQVCAKRLKSLILDDKDQARAYEEAVFFMKKIYTRPFSSQIHSELQRKLETRFQNVNENVYIYGASLAYLQNTGGLDKLAVVQQFLAGLRDRKLAEALAKYPVSSVPEILSKYSDLIDDYQNLQIFKQLLQLKEQNNALTRSTTANTYCRG